LDSLNSLLIVSLSTITLALTFWPKRGWFWKWRRGLLSTQRVLVEDALKHLYDQEYRGHRCTLESLAGVLAVSGDTTAKLMGRLETLGLVTARDGRFELTSAGRSYALRMIRIHRLWERYLADETGLAATEWHQKAEKLEHQMTEAEADALANATGHPSYDPHGDPIPTSSGVLPPKRGQALTDLAEGQLAQVIHIEDEPRAIYAQLVAQGLNVGTRIRIVEKTADRIHFIADGEENVLAPVIAANVTIEPLPKDQKMGGPFETLASLKVGEQGEVIGISKACRGLQRRRLMDLGIIPGTVISAEMKSFSGDPVAYNIRGAAIALRKNQAEMIQIKRLLEAA
jgi:DtxR family Mn-dependent transcriptional regulator